MKKSVYSGILITILIGLIFTNLTCIVNAGLNSTLIYDDSCDTFIYSWENVSMPEGPYSPEEDGGCWDGLELFPRNTDIKMLNVTYGDANLDYASDYNRNYFYWAIVDEPNTEHYGQMFIGFKFWDINWTRRVILYYKQTYDIDSWNGMNDTYFGSEGDVEWIDGNVSYRGGISNLTIGAPVLNESGNILTWSAKYKSYSASRDYSIPPSGGYNWTYNSSFFVNHTFHFSFNNHTTRLKVDVNFSDFDIDPSMQGPNYEQANMTSYWDLNIRYHDNTSSQWVVNGEVLAPGETKSVSGEANYTINEYNISTINFGDQFLINDTEIKNLITNVTAEIDFSPTETNEYLHMIQIFPNLDVSKLLYVEMDPQISIYHLQWESGDPVTTNPPTIPGFISFFVILSIISLIVFKLKTKQKEVI